MQATRVRFKQRHAVVHTTRPSDKVSTDTASDERAPRLVGCTPLRGLFCQTRRLRQVHRRCAPGAPFGRRDCDLIIPAKVIQFLRERELRIIDAHLDDFQVQHTELSGSAAPQLTKLDPSRDHDRNQRAQIHYSMMSEFKTRMGYVAVWQLAECQLSRALTTVKQRPPTVSR